MARPWYQLISVKDDFGQRMQCMTFSSIFPGQYLIVGTEDQKFILAQEGEQSDAVVVVVSQEGKVTLKIGTNASILVQVNEKAIEKGETSPELKIDDRLKIGGRSFVFKRRHSTIAEIRAAMHRLVQCSICLRTCENPNLLKCGHSFCQACLSQMIRLSMTAPGEQIRFDATVLGIVDENELLQQSRTISCGSCRRKFSCWEATKAYKPIVLVECLDLMQQLIDFEDTRVKCQVCHDARSFADVRDYEYCERCRLILCSVCAMEGHRDHELRDRRSIIAAMHESGKRLAMMKMSYARLRQKRKVLDSTIDANLTEMGRFYSRFMPNVYVGVSRCKKLLGEMEKQALPFALINAKQIADFDVVRKETQAKMEKVDAAVMRLAQVMQEVKAMIPSEE